LLFSINSSSRSAARGVGLLPHFGEQWPKRIEWFGETSENQCSTSVKMPTGLSWEVQLDSCHRFFCVHVRRGDLRTKLWDTIKGLQCSRPTKNVSIFITSAGSSFLPFSFSGALKSVPNHNLSARATTNSMSRRRLGSIGGRHKKAAAT
jgi:hypothetical protein